MIIYDEIYIWEGWGGALRLGSGKCRLRICDLEKSESAGIIYLRPIVVMVSDIPESGMSVRSCAGHIATGVVKEYNLDPHRMLYVEYYPPTAYGENKEHIIKERYDAVDFIWHDDKAIQPKWRALKAPMLDIIKQLVEDTHKF
jgi:hypothetical protein